MSKENHELRNALIFIFLGVMTVLIPLEITFYLNGYSIPIPVLSKAPITSDLLRLCLNTVANNTCTASGINQTIKGLLNVSVFCVQDASTNDWINSLNYTFVISPSSPTFQNFLSQVNATCGTLLLNIHAVGSG